MTALHAWANTFTMQYVFILGISLAFMASLACGDDSSGNTADLVDQLYELEDEFEPCDE